MHTYGAKDDPTRLFILAYLRENLTGPEGLNAIDIGCGTGYVSELLFEFGAANVDGVEPSQNNVEIAQRLYPRLHVTQASLQDFESHKKYDLALCVMVFEHILDIEGAFRKIGELLNNGSKFYLVIGDKDIASRQRFDYDVIAFEINKDTSAVATYRPNSGMLYDIFHSVDSIVKAANKTGFLLERHVQMLPTDDLIQRRPKYNEYRDQSICHLLIFKK